MLKGWYRGFLGTLRGDLLDGIVQGVKDPVEELGRRVDSILNQARVDGETEWMYIKSKGKSNSNSVRDDRIPLNL